MVDHVIQARFVGDPAVSTPVGYHSRRLDPMDVFRGFDRHAQMQMAIGSTEIVG